MNESNDRELTIEEMIELGYDTKRIHDLIDKKIALKEKKEQSKHINESRTRAVAAIKDYLYALGVPTAALDSIPLDEALMSFEKEMSSAIKVLNAVPAKKEDRISLDEDAFESALATLRAFADSL